MTQYYKDRVTGLIFRSEIVLEGVALIKRMPDNLTYRIPSHLLETEFECLGTERPRPKKVTPKVDKLWADRLAVLLMPVQKRLVKIDFGLMEKEGKTRIVRIPAEEREPLERVKPRKKNENKDSNGEIIKIKDLEEITGINATKIRRILRKIDHPKPYEWDVSQKDEIIKILKDN